MNKNQKSNKTIQIITLILKNNPNRNNHPITITNKSNKKYNKNINKNHSKNINKNYNKNHSIYHYNCHNNNYKK